MFAGCSIGRKRPLAMHALVAVTAVTLVACSDKPTTTLNSVLPGDLRLVVVSGDTQTALPGSTLPNPVVVRATNSSGAALGGQIINFHVTAGGGSVFAGTALTDANGYAREWWTLGSAEGRNSLEARAVNPTTGERLVFATFNATASNSPPPPPPAPTPNVVFNEDWEAGNFNQWPDGPNATYHQIVNDPTQAHSGNRFLRITYVQNGDGGFLNHFMLPGYDSLYVSYWVRFPVGWQGLTKLLGLYGGRINDQWSGLGKAGSCPTGRDWFAAYMVTETGNPGPLDFYSYYVGMPKQADGVTCWGVQTGSQYYSPGTLSQGGWHHLEWWVKSNTPGSSNGYQRLWVDGSLRGDWSNLRFRDTDSLKMNVLQITANRATGSTILERLDVDDVLLSTSLPSNLATTPPSPTPVASVVITPSSNALVTGQTAQLNGIPRDAAGNTLSGRAITWVSSNPTVASVSSAGLVTALAVGSTTISATSEGQTGTASVSVTAPVLPVASVVVTPVSASLTTGQTQQFTAITRDASGNTLTGRLITWTSSNTTVASVSASGVVTAVAAGSATITATSAGINGTASVAVTNPTTPPSAMFTNEPTGMTLISDYGFDALNTTWWYQQKDATATIVQDPTAPIDPYVLQMNYPTGFVGGYSPAAEHPPRTINDPNNLLNRKEMFLAFWWKSNPEWQNEQSNINKLAFAWQNNTQAFYICWQWWDGSAYGTAPKSLAVNHLMTDGSNITSTVPGNFSLLPGVWYKIEWYVKLATTTTSNDGVTRAWVNGQLVLEKTGISRAGYLSDVYIDPTWGGGGSIKQHDDYFRYAHVRLSVR